MPDDPFEAWIQDTRLMMTFDEWMEAERQRDLRVKEDRLRQMYGLQNVVWGQAFPQQGALTRNGGLNGGLGGMLGGGLGQWIP